MMSQSNTYPPAGTVRFVPAGNSSIVSAACLARFGQSPSVFGKSDFYFLLEGKGRFWMVQTPRWNGMIWHFEMPMHSDCLHNSKDGGKEDSQWPILPCFNRKIPFHPGLAEINPSSVFRSEGRIGIATGIGLNTAQRSSFKYVDIHWYIW